MLFTGKTNDLLQLETIDQADAALIETHLKESLTVLWFLTDDNLLEIDTVEFRPKKDQIICLTELHKVKVRSVGKLRFLRFNRPFYCIVDHDEEVSCKGLLFFGASQVPVICVPTDDLKQLSLVWEMFEMEMRSDDRLQLEMLQVMLKRFLILCTRMYKRQQRIDSMEQGSVDLIREYHFLVEKHFKTKHTVADYAAMLNRSPKTIANLFSKVSDRTPLQVIQDRILIEARRLLSNTDRSIKEIAYELGYDDQQSFSRYFKTKTGNSPSDLRIK